MRVGTKSVLFGVHAFWLHPWFVALAWWKLYGDKWVELDPGDWGETRFTDWRLWLAFFLHDIGYFGLPNMDGPEGERHPYVGADLLGHWFGPVWRNFMVNHSRFLTSMRCTEPSALCYADKLAIALTPWWLYVPMARFTGEIREYKRVDKHIRDNGYTPADNSWKDDIRWFRNVQLRMRTIVQNGDVKIRA